MTAITTAERTATRRVQAGRRYAGVPTVRTMTDRIVRAIESATPAQRADGAAWYERFAMVAERLADRHGVTVREAAGVLAIVSPRITVAGSVVVADAILRNYSVGLDPATGVPGLSERIRAAADWLTGVSDAPLAMDDDGLTTSRKVRSFWRNILGETAPVTVDVWAARVAGCTVEQPSGGAYVAVAHAYRLAARRLGMTPREAQAAAWCSIRDDVDAGEELAAILAQV